MSDDLLALAEASIFHVEVGEADKNQGATSFAISPRHLLMHDYVFNGMPADSPCFIFNAHGPNKMAEVLYRDGKTGLIILALCEYEDNFPTYLDVANSFPGRNCPVRLIGHKYSAKQEYWSFVSRSGKMFQEFFPWQYADDSSARYNGKQFWSVFHLKMKACRGIWGGPIINEITNEVISLATPEHYSFTPRTHGDNQRTDRTRKTRLAVAGITLRQIQDALKAHIPVQA